MGLFFLAWAAGEGLVTWRWLKHKAPPTPGALLLPSGIFIALAALAEYQPARGVATALAWSVNLAVLVQVAGKDPGVQTGWPPPKISDSTVFLPSGVTTTASGPALQ